MPTPTPSIRRMNLRRLISPLVARGPGRRVLGHRLKKSPSQGQTQFHPGPRKNEPMKVTIRPPIIRQRKKTQNSFRSRAAL